MEFVGRAWKRLRAVVLRLLALALCLQFSLAFGVTREEYATRIRALIAAADHRYFTTTSDNKRLSYAIFGQDIVGENARPAVVLPGRGESYFRYAETADELMRLGYGPIYVLEHYGQGFSDRPLPDHTNATDIRDFRVYPRHFLDFVDHVVTPDLKQRGILTLPFYIGHSMGGAILRLAYIQRPDIANKLIFIAPMYEIDLRSRFLNFYHDLPAEIITRALTLFGFGTRVRFSTERSTSENGQTMESIRRGVIVDLEKEANIRVNEATAEWVATAIQGTHEIAATAAEQSVSALYMLARYDRVVRPKAVLAAACSASNCTVISLKHESHAVHLGTERGFSAMVLAIDQHVRDGKIEVDQSCASVLVENSQLVGPAQSSGTRRFLRRAR